MKAREFLIWLHERMAKRHNENPLLDYMHTLRALIRTVPHDLEIDGRVSYNSLKELVVDLAQAVDEGDVDLTLEWTEDHVQVECSMRGCGNYLHATMLPGASYAILEVDNRTELKWTTRLKLAWAYLWAGSSVFGFRRVVWLTPSQAERFLKVIAEWKRGSK